VHQKLNPKAKGTVMNVANLVVTKGLVAQSNITTPQLIQVTASTANIHSGEVDLTWHEVDNDGGVHGPLATAKLLYGNPSDWLSTWSPMAHLIHGRIDSLQRLAAEGKANRFSGKMAYTLFASNLVDYSEKYRGMQSIVMNELEGFADVQLTTKESGVWTVPPYFIDSVAHLAGFIMNCSDAMDAQKTYCVTPGWKSMRFAKPLLPGAKYRSYVKMIPTAEDPNAFFGDVYIMQDDVIVGMVGGIEFHRYPRILLAKFFSPPDKMAAVEGKAKVAGAHPPAVAPASVVLKPAAVVTQPTRPHHEIPLASVPTATIAPPKVVDAAAPLVAAATAAAPPIEAPIASNGITFRALQLIADEAGLEMSDLEDDVGFADLGVDSLMSLVISEKFRIELDVKVNGSLFLDYPTIGDLRAWLDECYG
jgi:monodictyphenone polyketide synthase